MDPGVREQALALDRDSLDPRNLYNLTWKDREGQVRYIIAPPALTGIDTPIVVLCGRHFPTGSHKVGPAYCCAVEMQLEGGAVPGKHTLVWPSTGNYGVGGAWVGPRLGYRSLVVLPEEMSRERFEMIEAFGAEYIKTVGCESNVKEIYDEVKRLRGEPRNRIVNQFEVFPNYRFHFSVTGPSALEAVADAHTRLGIGGGRASAFVSAMGSAGTIAAGEYMKREQQTRIVGLEPVQCPTLFANGYGGHDIQGIGDKHVTWIHNVFAMDLLCCLDDIECKKVLQVLVEEPGMEALRSEGLDDEAITSFAQTFGISGICNLLGAIKTAKHYRLGKDDVVVTVATDSIERYRSTMDDMTARFGALDQAESHRRLDGILRGQKSDWIQEGTQAVRERWHNLKYFTWVEQQGKTVEELDALRDPEFWVEQQAKVPAVDRRILEVRGGGGPA